MREQFSAALPGPRTPIWKRISTPGAEEKTTGITHYKRHTTVSGPSAKLQATSKLVATDNLAEVLLYRHAQFTLQASEETGVFPTPRFDDRVRRQLRQDFDRRVTLATVEHAGVMTFHFPKPILSNTNATIFRVSHRYRNAIYHEDRHNNALIAPLVRLYISAVGRAWYLAQHPMGRPGMVERLVSDRLRSLEVRPGSLAKRLASDLIERSRATDALRRELSRRGLLAEAQAAMLLGAEVRERYRADPEDVRLKDEMAAVLAELVNYPEDAQPASLQQDYIAKRDAEQDRIDGLRAGFQATLNLRTSSSIRHAAERLEQVSDVDRLISRYEAQDRRTRLLEICLDAIDRDWDRIVSHEEEVARGK